MTNQEFIHKILNSDCNNYDHKGQMYGPYLNYGLNCNYYGYMKKAKRHGEFVCTYYTKSIMGRFKPYSISRGFYKNNKREGIWNFYGSNDSLIQKRLYIS